MKKKLYFHSFVDLITNSSTEMFVIKFKNKKNNKKNNKELRVLLEKIFELKKDYGYSEFNLDNYVSLYSINSDNIKDFNYCEDVNKGDTVLKESDDADYGTLGEGLANLLIYVLKDIKDIIEDIKIIFD